MTERAPHEQQAAVALRVRGIHTTPRLTVLSGILLIGSLAVFTLAPCLRGPFILDDDRYVTDNRFISSSDGLYRFWLTTEPLDYYPVSNTSLWVEWRLWGNNPIGYRATNIALHIGTALLLWHILRTLSIPGAFLAALLWVVHPMNVVTVAWIAQRKEVLAAFLFLLSIVLYLRQVDAGANIAGRTKARGAGFNMGRWYWLSLFTFLLAMLSKGSVAILPFVLLLIDWWRHGKVGWRDYVRMLPYFVIAVPLAFVHSWYQAHGDLTPRAPFAVRLASAGAAVWFYLSKSLLPINLSLFYPRWNVRTDDLLWWLPLVVALLVTWILWKRRSAASFWQRPVCFAWLYFCAALFPMMGFAETGHMKFSRVADHYVRLALIGVLSLAAAGWSYWCAQATGQMRKWTYAAMGMVVGISCVLACRESSQFGNPIELYQVALADNPYAGWFLHNNLGILLMDQGRIPEAIEHYEAAIKENPDHEVAQMNLGIALAREGRLEEAIEHYQRAVQIKPDFLQAQNNLGNALARVGRSQEAVEHLEAAVRLKPESAPIHNNLGATLADLRRFPEAIDQYRQAIQLDPNYAGAYFNLAKASAKLNRSSEALAAAQNALDLARSQGQSALAQKIEAWLTSNQGN